MMTKTLSHILTVFKVVKIISKVVFILCIVGGAGSLLGLLTLPLLKETLTVHFFEAKGLLFGEAYAACLVGLVACIGEAILAFLAGRYFGNVLNAGTPFTFEGAKEAFRFGVTSLIVSVATSTIAGMALGIFTLIWAEPMSIDIHMSIPVSTGLFFMFLSLIFKHGAEQQSFATPEIPKVNDININ